MTSKNASDFYDLMVSKKMYSSKSKLKFYLNNLFENVDFTDKEVLDVGGGRGLLSFYAAVEGARQGGGGNKAVQVFLDAIHRCAPCVK